MALAFEQKIGAVVSLLSGRIRRWEDVQDNLWEAEDGVAFNAAEGRIAALETILSDIKKIRAAFRDEVSLSRQVQIQIGFWKMSTWVNPIHGPNWERLPNAEIIRFFERKRAEEIHQVVPLIEHILQMNDPLDLEAFLQAQTSILVVTAA
jgi:hypothetical protein